MALGFSGILITLLSLLPKQRVPKRICAVEYPEVRGRPHGVRGKEAIFDLSSWSLEKVEALISLTPDEMHYLLQELGDMRLRGLLVLIVENPDNTDYMMALHVALGIRPAMILERPDETFFSTLRWIARKYPNLKFVERPTIPYFINETPQAAFKAERYCNILPNVQIEELLDFALNNDMIDVSHQLLSYLLGYGPGAWEAFASNIPVIPIGEERCFTDQHYIEMGLVFNRENPLLLGKRYSMNLRSLRNENHFIRQYWHSYLFDMGMQFLFDGLVLRTGYFRKALSQKRFVFEQLFINQPFRNGNYSTLYLCKGRERITS